jgi:hypothetical protein
VRQLAGAVRQLDYELIAHFSLPTPRRAVTR